MSATKSSIKRTTNDDTSLYSSGRTYSEQQAHIMSSLHSTTGSIALSHASKTAAAMQRAAPQNTPAKKAAAAGAKSAAASDNADDGFNIQMASAAKAKRNPDGRPSIGTIENQWEYIELYGLVTMRRRHAH